MVHKKKQLMHNQCFYFYRIFFYSVQALKDLFWALFSMTVLVFLLLLILAGAVCDFSAAGVP